jgi:hypothetical protein
MVLPITAFAVPDNDENGGPQRFAQLMTAIFRGAAVARISGKYPSRIDEHIARAAGEEARRAVYIPGNDLAADAARAAVYAADTRVAARGKTRSATRAILNASYAFNAAEFSLFWPAISRDAGLIEAGCSAPQLADLPLWDDWEATHPIIEWWEYLKAALPKAEDWHVWIDWYEARLSGDQVSEEEELIYATVPVEKWDEGYAAANAWIKAELERLRRNEPLKVPPRLPAAIEPIVSDGRITLPQTPVDAELDEETLEAALEALRAQIGELADDLGGEINIDRRVAAFLHRLSEKIPARQPRQAELFILAHEQETLESYAGTVVSEWPELLSGRYLAVTRAFDRTARQFPKWRELKQNAAKDRLTPEQRAEAPRLAAVFVAALRAEDAPDFVAPEISATLENMWRELDAARDTAREGRLPVDAESLAKDAITSIENVVKLMAEIALDSAKEIAKAGKEAGKGYFEEFGKSAVKQAKKEGGKDGVALIKWAKRAFIVAGTGLGAKAVGVGGVIAELSEKYPQVGEWLRPIIQHFSH